MKKEEQIIRFREFLVSRYGLHIEDWMTLDELLVSGYTVRENIGVLIDHLKRLLSEYPRELAERLTSEAFEELRLDLATQKFQRNLEKEVEES